MSCEHCWYVAGASGEDYRDVLSRAEAQGWPCTKDNAVGRRMRAGQFWDEATQRDTRTQLRAAHATPVPPPPSPETAPPRNAIQEHFADVANGRDDEASVAGNPARNPTDARRLAERITEYLSAGGLFNPEMMEHGKVRDLLIDCRAAISIPADAVTTAKAIHDLCVDFEREHITLSGATCDANAVAELLLAIDGYAHRIMKQPAGHVHEDSARLDWLDAAKVSVVSPGVEVGKPHWSIYSLDGDEIVEHPGPVRAAIDAARNRHAPPPEDARG